MKASLTDVSSIILPRRVASACQDHLASMGRHGLEGMVLWAGVQDGAGFEVREAIIPQQQGTRTEHGLLVTVGGDELHRLNLCLYRSGLRLVAQVHSHPGRAYHSDTDDQHAIATALGSLSLVVPDFAQAPFSVASCAVYRLSLRPRWGFDKRPHWAEVPPANAHRLIQISE